jgi:flavorubredoxin
METRIEEVGDDLYQVATYIPDIDFGFNQYLVTADEPLLFHTGLRGLFPQISQAVTKIMPLEQLRWISFGHVEADECGSLNEWLAAAPEATVVQGNIGCMVSISDIADRPPRPLADGEVLDIGGHRMRWIDTPHVPHAWEAGVMFDEATNTLLCGDLFSQYGAYDASTTNDVAPAAIADPDTGYLSLHPTTGAVIRRLADLEPSTLALMHGPTYKGDGAASLRALAEDLEYKIDAAA